MKPTVQVTITILNNDRPVLAQTLVCDDLGRAVPALATPQPQRLLTHIRTTLARSLRSAGIVLKVP